MKKAYVKVKNNSAKSIFKRPYIAATLIGAALCAIVLSVSMPQQKKPPEEEWISLPMEETQKTASPEPETTPIPNQPETTSVPKQPEKPSVPEQNPEVTVPQTNETAVEETVSVGLFGTDKNTVLTKPVDGEMLKPFSAGKPVKSKTMGDWRVHNGMDIRAKQGAEVRCCADGEVIRAEIDGLTGATVSVDHGNGTVSTVYNLENTDRVKVGQKVKAGEIIGTAGNTAKCEMMEDAHIHFEVMVDGNYVNPETLLR